MDEVVTYDVAAQWLPRDVQRELLMAMPPEMRGWWTAEEADADGGRFIEVRKMSEAEGRYWRT
jgi:hypothetical protein